jgi:hypothetical protein
MRLRERDCGGLLVVEALEQGGSASSRGMGWVEGVKPRRCVHREIVESPASS